MGSSISISSLVKVGRSKSRFAGLEPVQVTLQRIDLSVMSNKAERLGQFPGGEGIGGKAGVYQTKGAYYPLCCSGREVRAHLHAGELTFIDNGFIRQGGDVKPIASSYRID